MFVRGLIDKEKLWELFLRIEPAIPRYPALNATGFRNRVGNFRHP
jgi:hypothetical protein